MIKTFNVDWDNPKDLKKLSLVLKQRRTSILRKLGYDEVKFNGSKYNIDLLLPVVENMINHMYDENDEGDKNCYVYFHCNPLIKIDASSMQGDLRHIFLAQKFGLEFEPFYVGKGSNGRAYDLNRSDGHRKTRAHIKKLDPTKEVIPVIVRKNLTDKQAKCLESNLMDILGLKVYSSYGMLVNLDEGENSKLRRNAYTCELAKKIMKKNGYCF